MRTLTRVLLAVAMALASVAAIAAPVCFPAKPTDLRVGTVFNPDGSAAGAWAYWWCNVNGVITYEWRAAPTSSFTPDVLARMRSYALGRNPGFANTPLTLPPDAPVLAALKAAVDAAAKADAGKPVTTAK